MRLHTFVCTAAIATILAVTAQAADTAKSHDMDDAMMMEKGHTMIMMPDGTMGMVATPDALTTPDAMKLAKPLDHCVMMTMGKDGKMYTMDDIKMADGMMACDTMKKTLGK